MVLTQDVRIVHVQVAVLKVQMKDRQRRGEVKKDSQGNITDKATRVLLVGFFLQALEDFVSV
jgi:hypothetical protein